MALNASLLRKLLLSIATRWCQLQGFLLRPLARLRGRKLIAKGITKFNCGCGSVIFPGWVNIDLHSTPGALLRRIRRFSQNGPTLYADLTRGLPFDDEVATHIYSNNFLEHLERQHVLKHLQECYRVLKPTGRLRVVVPDLEQYIRAYVTRDSAFFQGCAESSPFWPQWCETSLEYVMVAAQGDAALGWIHKWAFDEETLRNYLVGIGFREVRRAELGISDDANLVALDGFPYACVAVEAIKPPAE